nr:7-deoxyloganetic acid glucosyltransferase-like [Ipomoea batatas]
METFLRRRDLPAFCRSGDITDPKFKLYAAEGKGLLNSRSYGHILNTLWPEDRSCLAWPYKQPRKSVIYVSFGSIATLTKQQLMEFWHGLVNSEQRFLWVFRREPF